MAAISGVNPKDLLTANLTPPVQKSSSASFADTIAGAVGKVDALQKGADQAIEDLATGRRKTLHETLIQVEQANIAFQLFMSVRNKAISAYQEVMRMHF